MKRLATVMSILPVVLVLSWELPATASALPQIRESLKEGFPVSGGGSVVAPSGSLSSALSAPMTLGNVVLLFECKEEGSLCPYTLEFFGAAREGKECNTAGDFTGVVLVKSQLHFVWSELGTKLNLVADLLMPKFTVICIKGAEELKVTIEGQALGKIEGVSSGVSTTEFSYNLKCTKSGNGKQEIKEYFNDEATLIKGVLTVNLGLGSETACLEVNQLLKMKTAKMFNFSF